MKRILLFFIAALTLLAFPMENFGQAPNLGTAGNFAVFTAAGAFNCTGASVVTGDVGTAEGAFNAFPPGTLYGVKHVLDPISTQASVDVKVAYSDLFGRTCGAVIGTTLGNGQVLTPNVYCLGAASTLNGDLILDGGGDPNALFIFKIDGALSTNANSNVILTDGASSCNVYWQIGQAAGFGVNSTFRGTIVANGAISFSSGAKLFGRALSQAGAISLSDNVITAGGAATASTITAGGATSFCVGGSVILSGNVGGVWSTGATTASITVNTSGDYFVTNTSTCGDATSNHIVVTVNPLPAAATGSNVSICSGNTVTIGASAILGHTYSWTPTAGLSSATIANPVASPTTTTTYTLTETITATGCQKTNSVIVTVEPVATASVISAGSATTFCAGGSVTLSGNIGGIWSNGATTPSITVNTSGDYFVTNSNACGSVTSNHILVTVNPLPAAVAGANRAICLAASTQIGATAIPGNTYSWTSIPAGFTSTTSNPTVTPLVTTTYTLVETITATGCQATNSVTVTVDLLPPTASIISAGSATTFCAGGSVTLSGNIGGVWSNGATTASITVNTSGDYFVTNTSGCGVEVTSNHISVTVNLLPAAVTGADRSICLAASTQIGAAAVPGNTYSWTSVPAGFTSTTANPTVTPLLTTTYTLVETITATGCQATNSVTVAVDLLPPTASVITAGSATTFCAGGSITLSGNIGGVWSNGATTASITVNTSGDYFVTNTSGCGINVNSNHISVTVNPLPAAVAGANRAICLNESTTLGAAAILGSTYSWSSSPAGFSSTTANPLATPLVTTTYTVVETVTATGCTNSNSIVVTVNPLPAAIAGADRSICLAASTQIGAAAVPGNTYSWTSVPAGFTSTTANPTVTPLLTTTYTLVETITATGCQATNSVTVTVDLLPPTASIISAGSATTFCTGGSVTLSGNIGGVWSNGASTPSITVNTSGNYFVTNTSGCGVDITSNHISVTVNPLPAAVAGANRTICLNEITSLGAAAVPGNTYSWTSIPAGFTSTLANPTVSPRVTTTYTVVETITATGCTNSNSVVVTVNPLPAAFAGEDRGICLSTSTQIGAIAVAGSTYSWSSVPAGFTSTVTNPTVTPVVTTTYTVVETITATGCTNSHSVVVRVNLAPAALAGEDRTICLNTSTQIGATAVAGSTYSWSSVPAGFTSTIANPTVTPLVTTTYRVIETITATGCTNSTSVTVTVKPIPAAVAGAARSICMNEVTQIGATAVAGSTYSWSSSPTGFTSTIANPSVSPGVTTIYTVVETNSALNCTNSHSVVVTVNPSTAAYAGADRTICQNTGTQIGGVAVDGSTYSWSSVPAGFTSTVANPTVIPQVTTTYTVVETNAAIGCSSSNSVVVTVNPLPAVVAGGARAICLNESTTLGASAITGSTYSWSSIPAGFTSSMANPIVSPLVTTTYIVEETITATGCTNKNNVVVSVNPKPAAVAGANKAICKNESTQIGGVAVIGSTYSWSSVPAGFASTASNPTVSPLLTTTYTVIETITATGCTKSNSVVVTVNPIPAAVAGAERTICQYKNTQIGAVAIAGSTYSWSSVPAGFTSSLANPTVASLVTTTYTVVETTAAGCTNSNSVLVNVYPAPAAIAGADRSICLNANTQIGAPAFSGSTYKWSSVPAVFTSTVANPTVNPQVTTTYTLVETNMASGCQSTNSVTVSLYTAPKIIAEPTDQSTCVGSSVSFSVNATGTGLTYQWRKGTLALANGGNISGATSGTLTIYPVKTSDAASDYNVAVTGVCSSTEISKFVSLVVNVAPSISTSACVGSSVSFSASAIGTGLTYQWRKGNVVLTDGGNISGSNSPTLTINPVSASDASPNYNVLINGACSPDATSLNIGLVVSSAMSITAEPANQVACVGNSAIFSVGATGTGLTYQWRKGSVNLTNGGNISGATSATLTINPMSAADVASDYNVVVTGPCTPMATSKPASLSLCIPLGSASIGAGDTKNAITIYPNPFTSSIDIKVNDVSKIGSYELKIYNILGEEVINTLITKDITTLKTSNLTSGVYLYEVSSNKKTIQSGKLISQQ